MVTVGELIIYVALFSLLLIFLANRFNLQKYHLYVSSGFLMYLPPICNRFVEKLAAKTKFWEKFGNISLFPVFLLFIATPLFLILNLIRGSFFGLVPIFDFTVIQYLRTETFLLTIPVIFLFLSIQMLIRAVYNLIDGEEMDKSGLLLITIILMFFAKTTKNTSQPRKTKAISVIIIIQLVLVLLAVPIHAITMNNMDRFYGESHGAIITVIYPNSPAYEVPLRINDIITRLQIYGSNSNLPIVDVNITSASLLYRTLAQIKVGVEFTLSVLDDSNNPFSLTITGITPPADVSQQLGSYIGLLVEDYRTPTGPFPVLFPFWFNIFYSWVIDLGLVFCVYILLPIPKSWGYDLMEEMNEQYKLDFSPRTKALISYGSLLILALNVIYYIS